MLFTKLSIWISVFSLIWLAIQFKTISNYGLARRSVLYKLKVVLTLNLHLFLGSYLAQEGGWNIYVQAITFGIYPFYGYLILQHYWRVKWLEPRKKKRLQKEFNYIALRLIDESGLELPELKLRIRDNIDPELIPELDKVASGNAYLLARFIKNNAATQLDIYFWFGLITSDEKG